MPAIYAHDKFGKLVFEQLDGELKKVVNEYYAQFRIGLQGPDPLFYHRPYLPDEATREGSIIHRKPCSEFLKKAIEIIRVEGIDSGEYAYLMGFVCHFTLDSECHPYIDTYIKDKKIGHIALESEFEKLLMREDGVDPIHTDISKYIPTDTFSAKCMASFYDWLDKKKALKVLKEMHFERRLLFTPKEGKEKLLKTLFHMVGMSQSIAGLILPRNDNEECIESNIYLKECFYKCVALATYLLKELDETIQNGKRLNSRFDRNFEE